MRKFKIPNMGTLQAFEAAARHESVTHAAKELHLTESAISRQISGLEASLGVRLFVRTKQRLVLTRAGRLYSNSVRSALDALTRATLSVIAHGGDDGHLGLAMLPTFASHWLIPRLKDFHERHPGVCINMSVPFNRLDFNQSHFHAAIHYGEPSLPDTSSDFLFDDAAVPVCAPSLLAAPVRSVGDLLAYPLLHSTAHPEAWTDWFSELDVDDSRTAQGPRYQVHAMLVAAAVAGLGIALVPKIYVEEQLEQHTLLMPVEAPTRTNNNYYFVYPTEFRHYKPLEVFRQWLLEQAKLSERSPSKPSPHQAHVDGGGA